MTSALYKPTKSTFKEYILKEKSTANLLPVLSKNYFTGKFFTTIILLLLLFVCHPVNAQEKYANVKIYMPKDQAQRLDLLSLLQVDHFHEHDGAFNYTVDEEELRLLKASGYNYEIIHDDAVAYLESENNKYFESLKNGKEQRVAFEQPNTINNIIKTPAAFVVQTGKPNNGGYYRYGQMDTAIKALKTAYPSIVDTFSIGLSTQNRRIMCIKISDNPSVDEAEPEILFMGQHHAREAIGGASMIFLMQYLCENYTVDSRIKDLVDNREIFIIVCANPDGWVYNSLTNPNGGGQWRKNRSVNSSCGGCFGVDLNRNWGVSWADTVSAVGGTSVGTGAPASDQYWGSSQYSEPETRALRTFCRQRDFGAVMDQHSVGPYYSLPWGRSYNIMSGLDDSVYRQMSSVMGKYNGMRYGSTFQTLGYEVTGGMKDVLLRGNDSLPNGKCYGMTGEGSNGSSVTSFWPLAAEIIQLCKGMVYQDIQLIYTVGSYVDLQDIGSLNLQSKTGKFYFKARRIGLINQPVTISVIPIQNVFSAGSPKNIAIASLPAFNDTYTDSIPYVLASTITAGNSIKFAWKVETAGYTYYDTVTNIYQPNVLMSDNMETGIATTNWTINSGWAYTTDMAYNGTKSLAESPSTTYSDNIQLIAQRTTNLNLSGAGSAYLSFWARYRAENYRDFLRVEVSTNGTTWVALTGNNTVRYPGTADGNRLADTSALTGLNEFWSRQIFDLSNFLGATALRLRFRFNSGGNTVYVYDNDAGFNIDDVTVITGGTPSLLPVELSGFTGHNDGSVNILDWNTASEFNTKNFTVERSVNAKDYEEIGMVNAAGISTSNRTYTFTDYKPFSGENLYRLKMVDLDGSYKYSKLVSVKLKEEETALTPTGIENFYPNPTDGKMQINFNVTEELSTFNYRVFNVFGQMMNNGVLTLTKGKHAIELDATDYAKGEYFVSFSNVDKGISYENRFIKM